MSYEQNPPNPFPLNPIYNPNDWAGSRTNEIDIEFLDNNYLKFNTAQGTENLQAINVNGVLTANSNVVVNSTAPAGSSDIVSIRNDTGNMKIVLNPRGSAGAYNPLTQAGDVIIGGSEITTNPTGGTILTTSSSVTNGIRIGKNSMTMGVGGTTSTPTINTTYSGTTITNNATNITQNGAVIINANNNLTMNAGTGSFQQPIVVGDVSTRNSIKLSNFTFNSNIPAGTNNAFEFFDNVNGRGLFIVPNCSTGALSDTNLSNDCVLSSRSIQNTNAITISNWNSNMRNGLRVFTTDISNCGVKLQCGQNTGAGYTELAMDYNRISNITTTTFNNAINFNPTLPIATNSSRRLLSGLGTLSFTDISGNNSTNGSTTSAIWTDSSLVLGLGRGMFLDCSINGGDIIFRTNDANGVKSTSLALNGDLNTTYNRVYQEIQPTWNNVNGFYELAKDAYPTLNPRSSGVNSVGTWTTRTSLDLQYYSVCWSPELLIFVAVSSSGSGGTGIDRVATSPDGITWTARDCFAQSWRNVIWVSELGLFVANSVIGAVNQRVMTSPDGINWTLRTTPSDNSWRQFAWSPELSLLVCVSDTGGTDRVMTSPDGITWTARTTPNNNGWNGVAWSAELGLFVAVANTGTGNRVMTSPNGINWTARSSPADNAWRSVVWASEIGLFVAVSADGTLNRVMTSSNGINWTTRTTNNNNYQSVCWSPELKLFVAIASSGTTDRVMTSPNGIKWTTRTTNNNDWIGICWSPELGIFVGSSITGSLNRFMTSSLAGRPPTSFNVFDNSSNIISESGDWTLQANTIYATQLDIRRSYGVPLSRLEMLSDGANSSYIKARAPSGQATMFFNTYNGASDDDVFNITSARLQVRRPIGFSYLTSPSTATQLGFITGPTAMSGGSITSSASERNFGSFTIANIGTYSIKVLIAMTGGANHTLTECRWCLDGTSATFPSISTPTRYTPSITGIVGASLSSTYISYMNINLDITTTSANQIIYVNYVLNYSGGSTTTLNATFAYTRIG